MDTDWISKAQTLNLSVRNFVKGRWQAQQGGASSEKYGGRDGRLLYRVPAGAASQVEEVVAVARQAFEDGRWSRVSAQRRKDVLHKLASLIEAHRDELALLECLDVGKPISDPLKFDVAAAARLIRFAAEAADKFYGKVYGVDPSSLSYELRRPIGVVAGIVGWNFPFYLAASKLGPVLAAGNSLVLKPSEITSLTAARLAELATEAGVPEGVVNVVHGDPGIGAALAQHGDVDLVTFTGSSVTGKKLLVAAGHSNMKRLVLECGGKAPNIVFDDSPDLEAVARAVVARTFWNQGQVCTASSRLLVQASIKDKLLPFLIEKCSSLNPGDPLKAETTFGAVVSRGHQDKILSYIEIAQKQGARKLYQSSARAPVEGGFYVPPVIFDEVLPGHRIAQEEIFGPVLSILTFRDEAEAVALANGTIYGLSAILWTRDLGRAHRVTHDIRAGSIVVNATGNATGGPGEGVMTVGGQKQSGIGVEGGLDGLKEYTSATAVQYFV